MKELYPFQSNFIQVGKSSDNASGYKLHYITEGNPNNPALICLHGNPTWSFYFREVVKELSEKYFVVALDYIGCGFSEKPANKIFRAKDRVTHIEELLSHLKIAKYSLLMHDWGGPIGAFLAVKNSSSIESLTFLNTTLTNTLELPWFIKLSSLPGVGKFITQTTKRFLTITTRWGAANKLPKAVEDCYLMPYPDIASRKAIWDFVADIPFDTKHPTYTELMKLAEKLVSLREKPVKIIWGLQDPCFHTGMLEKVMQHFPQADVTEIPSASHLVLEDEPVLVISKIKQFLNKVYSKEGYNFISEDDSETVSDHPLLGAAQSIAQDSPQQQAIIIPLPILGGGTASTCSYSEFIGNVNRFRRGLEALGLKQGDRVLFLVKPSIEFLTLTYAVFNVGATPVFVDPGVGMENLTKCINDARATAVIASPKAVLLKILKPTLFVGIKFFLTAQSIVPSMFGVSSLRLLNRCSSKPLPPATVPDNIFIVYTSGATGTPKGVVYTDKMLRSQLNIFANRFGLKKGGIDMPLLPVFSMFSIALGVTTVFPPINPSKPLALEPELVSSLIKHFGVTTSFGSPTLWNKISEYCVRSGTVFPTLKTILLAGAPVPAKVLKKVQSMLPNGKAFTPYGATEALPVTFIGADELELITPQPAKIGGQGTMVGTPVLLGEDSVTVKVIAITNDAISSIEKATELLPFEIGELIVKGNNISPSYFSLPTDPPLLSNLVGKIQDDEGFWHRMGDVGYLDEQGRIYFCGRKAHIVASTENKVYFSEPVELVFNDHPKIFRSALVEVKKEAQKKVGLVVEPYQHFFPKTDTEKSLLISEIKQVAAASPLTKDIELFYVHPSFPVDGRHNAKVFRDKLGVWASGQ